MSAPSILIEQWKQMESLPLEILIGIEDALSNRADYGALAQTSRWFAEIARDPWLAARAKARFAREVEVLFDAYGPSVAIRYFVLGAGIKHGPYRAYYAGTNLLAEELAYCDGLREGECRRYHANGNLDLKCYFHKDKCEGEVREYWFKTGALRMVHNCVNDLVEGKRVIYYDDDSASGAEQRVVLTARPKAEPRVASISYWKNDKLEGSYMLFDMSGQCVVRCYYRRDSLNGPHRAYQAQGKLSCYDYYCSGERHGLHQEWHSNGRLALQVSYRHGQREGKFRSWYDNGRLQANGFYHEGRLVR